MPLPRYQPVKKKAKISSPSLDDLDDFCLAKVIAHALVQSKSRSSVPYVGDNGLTERRLSLVSKRWYFLTQTQVGNHGVHKIHLEDVLKTKPTRLSETSTKTVKTPRRPTPIGFGTVTASTKTPAGSFKLRPNYGVLSQRNLTSAMTSQQQQVVKTDAGAYDITLFRAIQSKLNKYKHLQLYGSITSDNFRKLMLALSSSRVERLDLLGVKIENAKSYLNNAKLLASDMFNSLINLRILTFTISSSSKDEPTNALLWTIYQRAINLKELQVYLSEPNDANEISSSSGHDCESDLTTTSSFIERITSAKIDGSHPKLARVVFMKVPSAQVNDQGTSMEAKSAIYSQLIKKVLSEERSIASLDTNDSSMPSYLILASNRLCTRLELRQLILTCPIDSPGLLEQLIKLQNLGTDYLSVEIDNFDQISDVKTIMESFKLIRPDSSKCVVNFYLKDQKFTDCEDKIKNLIQLSRFADINVHISALQRISIDCCHLMWSTGRALQAVSLMGESPGKCIFRITLQTYPVKPNTINPFEITIPFGKCPQYKISSTREDVVRHREIMKSLKRDCYHQFVKSVRENNT